MKRLFNITLLMALAALALGSCHRPKVIPEEELGAIFHDAMLINAYIGVQSIDIDSLNIYEPIFEKYGYTTSDVRHTINDFSRRKNARLGDVAEHMIDAFEKEAKHLRREVAKLDTIDNVANRRFNTMLLRDTAVVIKGAADSAQLRYFVPIKGLGVYDFSFDYTVDEKDDVRGRRIIVYKMRRDSSKVLVYQSQLQLTGKSTANSRYKIEERDSNMVAFMIDMADRQRVKTSDRNKSTRMTIHELKVMHQPPTEECVRRLFDEQTKVRIFADTMIRAIETEAKKRAGETASK